MFSFSIGLLFSLSTASLFSMEQQKALIAQPVAQQQLHVQPTPQEQELHNLYVDIFGLETTCEHHGNKVRVPQRFQALSFQEAKVRYEALVNQSRMLANVMNKEKFDTIVFKAYVIAKMQEKKELEANLGISLGLSSFCGAPLF